MKTPLKSHTDNCPTCSCAEWKFAKFLVLEGSTLVNTESSGGGFGGSAGIGQGQGGVGINYQGVDLKTTGTHISALVAQHLPPEPPPNYNKKQELLDECAKRLKDAAHKIKKVDEFAKNNASLAPGIFGNADSGLDYIEVMFDNARIQLEHIAKHERSRILWEQTRVCLRCGEAFVGKGYIEPTEGSFPIPEFEFEGKERCCTHCEQYYWKPEDTYYNIKLSEANNKLKWAEEWLTEEIKKAEDKNEGSWWRRLMKKYFPPNPERAKLEVETAQKHVAIALQSRIEAMNADDFGEKRYCCNCKGFYKLKTTTKLHS